MATAKSILNRISQKGGTIGAVAKLYVNDIELASQFISELKEQLRTNKVSMTRNWGERLVNDLEGYKAN